MQLHQFPVSVFPVQPPPLWYVTNGELTVGPVVTGLLMKGVEYGRVPEYCHVRAIRGDWRTLDSVREIAAISTKVRPAAKAPGYEQIVELEGPARLIRDEDELCYDVTRLSVIVTGAESAMLHYLGRSLRTLTTRSVYGPMSDERLGQPLPEHDPVLRSARLGRPVVGPPYGSTQDALSIRFASSQGGVGAVAMIPIFVRNTLTAMLELSRPGHAFRRTDLQRAERIVQRTLSTSIS